MTAILALKALAGMTLALSLLYWVVRANRIFAADGPMGQQIAAALLLVGAPALGATILIGNLGTLVAAVRIAAFALVIGALYTLASEQEMRDDAIRGIWIVACTTLLLRLLGFGR